MIYGIFSTSICWFTLIYTQCPAVKSSRWHPFLLGFSLNLGDEIHAKVLIDGWNRYMYNLLLMVQNLCHVWFYFFNHGQCGKYRKYPSPKVDPRAVPSGNQFFFNGNSSINLKVSMGTSSINGGLSIATFDDQSVHHIWFPWSLFPTKTYSEKLKKNKTAAWNNVWVQSCYILYIFWTCFFEHLSSWMVAQSNNSPFSMTHTHDWPTVPKQCLLHISLAFKQHCPVREKYVFFSLWWTNQPTSRIISSMLQARGADWRCPIARGKSSGDTGDSHLTLPVHLQVYLYICIYIYTLWLFNIAMENGPFMDDFPIKTSIYKGFSMAMLNNQMVSIYTQSAMKNEPYRPEIDQFHEQKRHVINQTSPNWPSMWFHFYSGTPIKIYHWKISVIS